MDIEFTDPELDEIFLALQHRRNQLGKTRQNSPDCKCDLCTAYAKLLQRIVDKAGGSITLPKDVRPSYHHLRESNFLKVI